MRTCIDACRKYAYSVIFTDSNVYINNLYRFEVLYVFKTKSIKIYIESKSFHPECILILKTLV